MSRTGSATRSTECSVCGRMILPGEQVRVFRDPERGGRRRPTCPLCHRQAMERGWVRDDEYSPPEEEPADDD